MRVTVQCGREKVMFYGWVKSLHLNSSNFLPGIFLWARETAQGEGIDLARGWSEYNRLPRKPLKHYWV